MASLPNINGIVNYLFELYLEVTSKPFYAIANNQISRQYNVYALYIGPHVTDPANYWIAWGGYYDNETHDELRVLFNLYLVEVFTIPDLQANQNVFYVDALNDILYVNLPYKPWQYNIAYTGLYSNRDTTFSSAPINQDNYSDTILNGKNISARLAIPSVSSQLGNLLYGVIQYNDFSVTVDNNDGFFDSLGTDKIIGGIAEISKTVSDPASYDLVRIGTIENISTGMEKITFDCYDIYYLFSNQICKKFDAYFYPGIAAENVGKDIPKAWGTVKNAPVFEINSDPAWIDYIIIDPDYLTSVSAVYDQNGNSISFTLDTVTGIIRVTDLDGGGAVIPAVSADITGSTTVLLGQIIIDEIINAENLPFIDGVWDTAEVASYIAISPTMGMYFAGGSSRTFLEQVLVNDTVFLILKTNGELTLRRWGETYNTWDVENWQITKKPIIDFKDATTYFTSVIEMQYEKNLFTDTYNYTYIDDTQEPDIFLNTRRSRRAIFNVDISDSTDRIAFATRILNRFGSYKETLTIDLGNNTANVNLLDTVNLTLNINGRVMSANTSWIVKQINPAQDSLVLESVT